MQTVCESPRSSFFIKRKSYMMAVVSVQYPYAITPNVSRAKLKRQLVFRAQNASPWCLCLSREAATQTASQQGNMQETRWRQQLLLLSVFRGKLGGSGWNGSLAVRGFSQWESTKRCDLFANWVQTHWTTLPYRSREEEGEVQEMNSTLKA